MIVQTKMNQWIVATPRGVGRVTLIDTRTARVDHVLLGDEGSVLDEWQIACHRVPMAQAMAVELES